jgi:AcrR family transcriptional regulator
VQEDAEGKHVPRTLNPEAHALRRDEFVDAAQQLIATRGYERLSVQEILSELGASKGAFYHYFDSKAALLEAVVARMTSLALAEVAPITDAPDLTALEKLQGLFTGIANWKFERKELVLEVLRVWYSDENTVMRDRFRTSMRDHLEPLLAAIVEQGVSEGTFAVHSPRAAAGMLVSLVQGANDAAGRLFFARQANQASLQDVEEFFAGYAEADERILGLTPGSLDLDLSTVRYWFR